MITDCVNELDSSVDTLGKERMTLEADLKLADMRLLVLHREWGLLKEFEKHDNALADKLAVKRAEKKDSDMKVSNLFYTQS